jgi:hypothetical protein
MRRRQTVHEPLDARSISASKLPVLEVEVVNDLRELLQRRGSQSKSVADRLE